MAKSTAGLMLMQLTMEPTKVPPLLVITCTEKIKFVILQKRLTLVCYINMLNIHINF